MKAVLVVVGISEYDQVLREQSEVNRMHEALKLFGDVSLSQSICFHYLIINFDVLVDM